MVYESTAFLNCPVKKPADILGLYLNLTNGLVRFTTDDRFNVLYKEGSFNWILLVWYIKFLFIPMGDLAPISVHA